jgi:flagellar hook-length control protein FliK
VPNAGPTRFAEVNHPPIVSTVRGQLLPSGGTMQIRLDPPELGALLIQVTVRDGLMAASFQTSNPEATQLLSHSLTQLKHSLENQGVSVDRLQVAQAPRGERSDNSTDRNPQQHNGQHNSSAFDASRQNDQQRREMLRRMWARLGVGDPLDLVA